MRVQLCNGLIRMVLWELYQIKKSDFIFSAPSHINNQTVVKKNIEKKIAKLNDKNIEIEITHKFKLKSKFLDSNFIGKILHIGKSSHVLPPIAAQRSKFSIKRYQIYEYVIQKK